MRYNSDMDLIQIGQPPADQGQGGGAEVDPVCGMRVEPAKAAGKWEYQGRTYYFCARSCLERFRKDPEAYLAPSRGTGAEHTAKQPHPGPLRKDEGMYTCPMHPDVVQKGPGICPKCGMALEPVMPVAGEGPDPELVDMQRRLWLGA